MLLEQNIIQVRDVIENICTLYSSFAGEQKLWLIKHSLEVQADQKPM